MGREPGGGYGLLARVAVYPQPFPWGRIHLTAKGMPRATNRYRCCHISQLQNAWPGPDVAENDKCVGSAALNYIIGLLPLSGHPHRRYRWHWVRPIQAKISSTKSGHADREGGLNDIHLLECFLFLSITFTQFVK
jgi:hypothetical protein